MGNTPSYDLEKVFATNATQFCFQYVPFDSVVVNILVFFIYIIRVIPAVLDSFYEIVGDKDTIRSKFNSLRFICWAQGDDNVWMQLGFKLDRYMNSVYLAVLNLVVLFILFITQSTVDVILNALAFEFVAEFDEEISKSEWFDENKRFLKAGVIEVILCGELLLEPMVFPKTMCKMFDIEISDYEANVGGPIYDQKLASQDSENPKFMNAKDKFWSTCAKGAIELGKKEAIWQFTENTIQFGIVDQIFGRIFGKETGVFKRYNNYCTWSRWEHVLFLPRIPKKSEIPEPIKSIHHDENAPVSPLTNFDPSSYQSPEYRFGREFMSVLKCGNLKDSVLVVYRRKKYHQIPFRFIDGVFEWFSFIFIAIIFPCSLIGYMYLVIACQPID